MRIKPILSRVVIEQDAAQDQTTSGLIIPDSAKEKPLSGKVVAVGDDAKLISLGDRVVYSKSFGTEVYIKNQPYMIMDEKNVLYVDEEI